MCSARVDESVLAYLTVRADDSILPFFVFFNLGLECVRCLSDIHFTTVRAGDTIHHS